MWNSQVLIAAVILRWQSQLFNPRSCGYSILTAPDLPAQDLPTPDLPAPVLL
jgi:hypothetical protein